MTTPDLPTESTSTPPVEPTAPDVDAPAVSAPADAPDPVIPDLAPTPAPDPVSASPDAVPGIDAPAPDVAPKRLGTGSILAAAVLAAFVVATFAGLAAGVLGVRLATDGPLSTRPSAIRVIPPKTDEPVVAAAASALPSVVNIDVSSKKTSETASGAHPSLPLQGNGSGVAFGEHEDGGTYIVTNAHVVDGADRIIVTDANGASNVGELIGMDEETDIAVVLIEEDLPVIGLADASKLLVGQTVVAIGSPYGLEHSVSSGVISALGRSLPAYDETNSGVYPLVDVIQTDASINPGNSGGALVDRAGKLIGINTAIYTDTGASGGIGFAIPVKTVKRVAGEIIKDGNVAHPFLGVIGQDVTPELIEEQKLTNVTEGAYVAQLVDGSTAKKAGVKADDVIVAVGDEPVRSMDELILQVRRTSVGDTITLTVIRAGKSIELKTKVGDKPKDFAMENTLPGSKEGTLPPNHPDTD